MLNHDDHRRLKEIERQLEREDPLLAEGMRQAWPRTRRWPFVALIVTGALLIVLGTAVLSAYLVMVGLACVAGGFILMRNADCVRTSGGRSSPNRHQWRGAS